MAIYYVAGNGSDVSGNGSSGNPWRSLGKAYQQSAAGDEVRVRNGTYNEVLKLQKASQTWKADTGHTPVLDGRYHIGLMSGSGAITKSSTMPRIDAGNYLPGQQAKTAMVTLAATGVVVDGLVVQNVAGAGFSIVAGNTTVRNCVSFFTYDSGIFSNPDDSPISGVVIENNVIRLASIKIFDPARMTKYAGGCDVQCVTGSLKMGDNLGNSVIRNNNIAWGFGEGINIGKKNDASLSEPIIVEGNVVHDINHSYLYINASRGIVLRNNTCYCTNIALNMWDGDAPVGIRLLDEVANGYMRDCLVYNNLVVNLGYAIDWGGRNTKATNVYVGHNTFVGGPQAELKKDKNGNLFAGVHLIKADTGGQVGIFENNIIDYSMVVNAPLNMTNQAGDGGIKMRNNNWSSLPIERGRGGGDVNENPQLDNSDKALTYSNYPTRATTSYAALAYSDNFDADDYRPTAGSPGRGKASNGSAANGVTPPADLDEDYFGAARDGSPAARDIGAIEFDGVVPNDVTAEFSFTPAAGVAPLLVTFTDLSTADGAAAINSWDWVFDDGGTSTQQNPTHTYNSAGSYTPQLTVQDTGLGLSDVASGPAIVVSAAPSLVTAGFAAGVVTGDAPLTVGFSDQSTGTVVSRLWQFGDGETSTETNPSHIYAAAGSYTVSLTVVSPTGHSDVEQKANYIVVTTPPDDEDDDDEDEWPELIIVGPLLALDGSGVASATHWATDDEDAGYLEIGHGAPHNVMRLKVGTNEPLAEGGMAIWWVDAEGNVKITLPDGTVVQVVVV